MLVSQSGADVEHNHHVHPDALNQRHAYDLRGIDSQGRFFAGDMSRKENWVGWGMPVVAAAAGEVVGMHDGARDVEVGEIAPDTEHPGGNRVVIRHDDGSFTWYAHLQRGSVRGELLGTRVEAGAVLGLVGNSGNTTNPHLHVHRQVGAAGSFDPAATGVELALTGARLIGAYEFAPGVGFANWSPAAEQPVEPRVARRGDVLAPGADT